MATFDPDQSLLPSVGGSITPMSGGGVIEELQEGGRVTETGPLLLESPLEAYIESALMRKVLPIIASKYFADKDVESDIPENIFTQAAADEAEAKIEQEVLDFVKAFPRNKKTTKIVSEKLGVIENSSESMIKVLNYINSQITDDKNIVVSLNKNTLVVTMKIPAPPEPKVEEPKKEPEEEPEEESEEEKPKGGKETTSEISKKKSKGPPPEGSLEGIDREALWNGIKGRRISPGPQDPKNPTSGITYPAPTSFFTEIEKIIKDNKITTLAELKKAITESSYTTDKDKDNKVIPGNVKNNVLKGYKSTVITYIDKGIEKQKKK